MAQVHFLQPALQRPLADSQPPGCGGDARVSASQLLAQMVLELRNLRRLRDRELRVQTARVVLEHG